MTILRHIHYEIPNIYPSIRYDTSCLHFAKLFKGNKSFGQWMPNSTHMHAEHNALRMIRTQKQRKNPHLTMVVLRFDSSCENLLMSRPCSRCIDLLHEHHIKTVIYSNDNGEMIKENTYNIKHKPSSMAYNIPKQGSIISFSKFKEMPPRVQHV
uniref:CMP/dCMP-type deaminase domain-containing protein n=1 Tax=viral metagenome TaxID=1070528 RepID=A0A6C0H320_9ZZZZ